MNNNKKKAEILLASQILYYNAEEIKKFIEGFKDTVAKSNFSPSNEMNTLIEILGVFADKRKRILENFDENHLNTLCEEILEYCNVIKAEKKFQTSFSLWMKLVKDKAEEDFNLFVTKEGNVDIEEICNAYYWACFLDYIESVDQKKQSYTDKLKFTPPVITNNLDDNDIIALKDIKETLQSESIYCMNTPTTDSYIKLQPTNLMYVAARPSVGKSMYVIDIALKNTLKGIKSLYISLEMSPEQTRTRINNWLKAESLSDDKREIIETNLFVINAESLNGESVFNKMEKFAKKNPNCIIIIDYINLIRYNNKDEWTSLREASLQAKKLALQFKCVVISCAMASRDSELSGLTMSSLFGSSTLEADSDIIIGLEPKTKNGSNIEKIDVKILKNRNGIKDVDFYNEINKETMHFSDV